MWLRTVTRHLASAWAAAVLLAAAARATSASLPASGRVGSTIPHRTPPVAVRAPVHTDSSEVLRGAQEGTVFRSLTVEGEDRIHIDFDRPPIRLDLDPEKAPGLDWGSARDVLDRTQPDLVSPLTAAMARERSPYVAHPWLRQFGSGAVARFRPQVEHVERWKLLVADSRGGVVASYQGRGDPPREIAWDGRSQSGAPVVPGLTYSYVFEAYDRAGNKRNFVGEGFRVSAYRLDTGSGTTLVVSGAELAATPASGAGSLLPRAPGEVPGTTPLLLEAATWLNQCEHVHQPVRVSARARSLNQANALASRVTQGLAPFVIGGAGRLQASAAVEPDAPEGGVVTMAAGK